MVTGLFIFRRDFRIVDNVGLMAACAACSRVYTCFVFTPEQVGAGNRFRSQNAIDFMMESLNSLAKEIRGAGGELIFMHGKNVGVVRELVEALGINAVFFNRDYSPYAVKRDDEIDQWCQSAGIECHSYADYYLQEPGTILNGSGGFYKKFTPFYRAVLHLPVKKVVKGGIEGLVRRGTRQLASQISYPEALVKYTTSGTVGIVGTVGDVGGRMVIGGRKAALERLTDGLRAQSHYDSARDFLKNETTGLSAYIKFGCVSIREVYWAFHRKYGVDFGLIRELIWREFFAHVLYGFPEVLADSYQPKFRRIQWLGDREHFEKWCRGGTGFPVVDASMRQLNATGYMHNRGRMIVATFLVKTLLLDWHLGERYFAQKLTDYDPASNNGNWQGISGTGVDMKPYFRDMNPWIQSAKFDKDCAFIKKWVPELSDVAPRDIHKWTTSCEMPKYSGVKYPKPMVDYDAQKVHMLEMYEKALK